MLNTLLLLLLAHPRERSPDINFVIITFNYSLNLQKEYNLVTYLHLSYSTFSVANDLSNCQSTTILQTSIKKKTRVGANLSNGSLIALIDVEQLSDEQDNVGHLLDLPVRDQ